MQIVFDSMTGNVRRFAQAVARRHGAAALDLHGYTPSGEFVLMTYTFGVGEVPVSTARFLSQYGSGLRGVVSSGSVHWGRNFGRAGEQIAAQYGVPLLARINKSGTLADQDRVLKWLAAHHAQAGTTGRHDGPLD